MKHFLRPAISVAALVLLALPVLASPLDDRVAELKHAMQKEAAAKAEAANGANGFVNPGANPAFLAASIDQMLAQMDNPAYGGNVEGQFAQITSVFTSEEVQEAVTNLLTELRKERKARTDAEAATLKALVQDATQKVNAAKKPEDLDEVIGEMEKRVGDTYGGMRQENQALNQQLTSALTFTKQYQDYLAHAAAGNSEQASRDLQSLTQNSNSAGLIPRSKLLELATTGNASKASNTPAADVPTPVSQAKAILESMKTLDDMEPALQKLEALQQTGGYEVQNARNTLSQLIDDYQKLKAGLPAHFDLNINYNGSPPIPGDVRAQLALLELQSSFDTYKGAPPAPSEKPLDYVRRVIADAVARQDWPLLRRAIDDRNFFTPRTEAGTPAYYSGGVENIIAGMHLEAAGQYTLAVQSYELALKDSDPDIPAKFIGDRLAAIQRDHSKEYADGLQLVTSPPGARVYQNAVPGLPYRPVMPTAPIPSTLLSPAGTNTATTSAAPGAATSTNAAPEAPATK